MTVDADKNAIEKVRKRIYRKSIAVHFICGYNETSQNYRRSIFVKDNCKEKGDGSMEREVR